MQRIHNEIFYNCILKPNHCLNKCSLDQIIIDPNNKISINLLGKHIMTFMYHPKYIIISQFLFKLNETKSN